MGAITDIVRTLGGPRLVPARTAAAAAGRSASRSPLRGSLAAVAHGLRDSTAPPIVAILRIPAAHARATQERAPPDGRGVGPALSPGPGGHLAEETLGSRAKATGWLHTVEPGARRRDTVVRARHRPRRRAGGSRAPAPRSRRRRLVLKAGVSASARHAAFDGEGARLAGGRWNRPGTAVVYTAETLSLAALELLAHWRSRPAPGRPRRHRRRDPGRDRARARRCQRPPEELAPLPRPEALGQIGTDWARRLSSVALSVPSVLVPRERNVLLNPAHADFPSIRVGKPEPFSFDPRLAR